MSGPLIIDATLFLGMHHQDQQIRRNSLRFFRCRFRQPVLMNFEQVGICDGVIWQLPRQVQDAYYPFMDQLHSEMAIRRHGYNFDLIAAALDDAELRQWRPERALLAAQVLGSGGLLFTHDPVLRASTRLLRHLGDFRDLPDDARFPAHLEALYEASCSFIHSEEDWQHVQQ